MSLLSLRMLTAMIRHGETTTIKRGKHHGKVWRAYDRQWREHSNDRRWRERHIIMWHDWYQWHRDNENVLKINVSLDSHGGPKLDIDYRN